MHCFAHWMVRMSKLLFLFCALLVMPVERLYADTNWCPSMTVMHAACDRDRTTTYGGFQTHPCVEQMANGQPSWAFLLNWYGTWYWYNGYTYYCPPGAPIPPLNLGACSSGCSASNPMRGNPVNAASGNKYQVEVDGRWGKWLTLTRLYNSESETISDHFGNNWRHAYSRNVQSPGVQGSTAGPVVYRDDGKVILFNSVNPTSLEAVSPTNPYDRLTEQNDSSGNTIGWTLFWSMSRETEYYDAAGELIGIEDPQGFLTVLSYSTSATPTSIAPGAGYLLNVTDPKGRVLNFIYNANGNIAQAIAPDGGIFSYGYASSGSTYNLVSVTYPDAKERQYSYVSNTSLLTSITDESDAVYANYLYNSSGQVTSSAHAGGDDAYSYIYNSDGSTDVTTPLGSTQHLTYVSPMGAIRVSSSSEPCDYCGPSAAHITYDSYGNPTQSTDYNGNVTATTYDANGLLDQQVDASGTSSQRTTNITWDTTLRVPLTRAVLNRNGITIAQTSWIYNGVGQTLARCEIDPAQASSYACAIAGSTPSGVRRWTYTYCDAIGSGCPRVGLLLSATGPRTDLTQTTTYSYYMSSSAASCSAPGAACYQAGDLYQVTDALGHVTTVASYDGAGRITRLTDSNGVNTDLTYTPRGWLASRSVGGATTSLTYTPYGAVASITDPDNVTTAYAYDTAHRLTRVTDALGNYVQYTLDAAGDVTQQRAFDGSGTLHAALSRTFNSLGQLTTVIDGLNRTVFNASTSGSYDANGNLVQSADASGIQSHLGYDALNRLVSTIRNYNGADTATQNTATTVSQDALDRVTGVTDPDALTTSFTYDGLSNGTQLQSPDTGISTDTYDAAGNRRTHTDAKGIVSTSIYDALNRRTSTRYADTTLNVSYAYDEVNAVTGCSASSPIGRLTRVVEAGVTTVFCYDGRGNVIQKRQMTSSQTDTTLYAYTAGNRLSSVSTPDQTAISYAYDSDGRVSGVQVTPSGTTAAPPTVVSRITYLPFGPISSYTLGNGQTVTRTYDANYQLTDLTSSALALHFNRDAMGNIIALGNAPGASPATETYSYDPLYRLTGISDAGTALESYTYNQTGDRLSKAAPGLATGAYLYTAGTHQLASIGNAPRANDANGNTTGSVIGGETFGFGYNGRNRLTVAQRNGQTVGTYTYNALGQRIGKVATFPQSVTERYVYDEAGQLIGEYGTTNRDYVWLGDLPVAVIDNTINGSVTTSTVNYVTVDQLGTPRVVTDATGTVIWSWAYQGNPFGEQQPTSTTGYVLNLRYPGQYYDAESGTNYNVNRNYDPPIGRYDQPDPMGQAAGPSLYAYVGGNPLRFIDPLGLQSTAQCLNPVNAVACAAAGMTSSSAGSGLSATAVGGAAAAAAAGSLTSDSTCPKDDCAALLAKIEAQVQGLQTKYNNMLEDEHDLYINAYDTRMPPPGDMYGTWTGHVTYYEGLQAGLNKLIAQAEAKGCPVPPEAYDWAQRPAPMQPNNL